MVEGGRGRLSIVAEARATANVHSRPVRSDHSPARIVNLATRRQAQQFMTPIRKNTLDIANDDAGGQPAERRQILDAIAHTSAAVHRFEPMLMAPQPIRSADLPIDEERRGDHSDRSASTRTAAKNANASGVAIGNTTSLSSSNGFMWERPPRFVHLYRHDATQRALDRTQHGPAVESSRSHSGGAACC